MRYALHELGISVLMYPEAGYSFDGRTTTLPRGLGFLAKKLDVPVVMITTYGAFQYQPLYNCLKKRKVQVKASARVLFTPEEAKDMKVSELDRIIDEAFSFDSLRSQQEQGIRVTEPDRALVLERVLYKCTVCGSESAMKGEGAKLICGSCGASWSLS